MIKYICFIIAIYYSLKVRLYIRIEKFLRYRAKEASMDSGLWMGYAEYPNSYPNHECYYWFKKWNPTYEDLEDNLRWKGWY